MALPDFVIIGAMKSGTSTLAAQLADQPGLFMADTDEINFFSDDKTFAKGLDWYEALFAKSRPGQIKGEVSTHYTKLPVHSKTIERLSHALTAPKFIYLIRNPMNRIVSQFVHEWTMRNGSKCIDEAIKTRPELVSYSCYGMQITPYVEAFGAESIFVSSLENLVNEPQETLEQVCHFLGVPHTPVWQNARKWENASAERIRRLPLHDYIFDNPTATALRRSFVPQRVRDKLKQKRQLQERPHVSDMTTRELEDVFAKDYAILSEVLPKARDLRSCYPFLPS